MGGARCGRRSAGSRMASRAALHARASTLSPPFRAHPPTRRPPRSRSLPASHARALAPADASLSASLRGPTCPGPDKRGPRPAQSLPATPPAPSPAGATSKCIALLNLLILRIVSSRVRTRPPPKPAACLACPCLSTRFHPPRPLPLARSVPPAITSPLARCRRHALSAREHCAAPSRASAADRRTSRTARAHPGRAPPPRFPGPAPPPTGPRHVDSGPRICPKPPPPTAPRGS